MKISLETFYGSHYQDTKEDKEVRWQTSGFSWADSVPKYQGIAFKVHTLLLPALKILIAKSGGYPLRLKIDISRDSENTYTFDEVEVVVEIYGNNRNHSMAGFKLSKLLGNRNIILSHGSYVVHHSQGKGVGTILHAAKEYLAAEMTDHGCCDDRCVLMCTVNSDNKAELKLLAKQGWSKQAQAYPGCDIHTKDLTRER